MSTILRNATIDENTNSIYSESTCPDLSKKGSKKCYTKTPLKKGEWDRNEVIRFFTCNAMFYKYGIPWKHLIRFILTRTVQQVYNKIKISQDAIKYVNENFWQEFSMSDFSDVNQKDYLKLFSKIEGKIAIFLSHNSKNIFHTKKQKLNVIPKIQMHHFSFTEKENFSTKEKSEKSSQDYEVKPLLMQLVRNISIEMGNEDFSTFLSMNRDESSVDKLIKIDYKTLMHFLVKKNEN